MTEISKDVVEAIQEAIKLEINGRKFFNHAADVTQHESGSKMFRFLAEEEVKHLDVFGKLFSKILKNDEWKNFVKKHTVEGEAPLVTKLKQRMKHAEGKGEIEAISVGMELEMNAITFFQQAAAKTADPTAKKIFRDIAEEEKFHYDLLQAQYDSVMHTGNWLGSAEFQMDGKW
jgi:rubrerythrin